MMDVDVVIVEVTAKYQIDFFQRFPLHQMLVKWVYSYKSTHAYHGFWEIPVDKHGNNGAEDAIDDKGFPAYV